jgi:hypothetical protein
MEKGYVYLEEVISSSLSIPPFLETLIDCKQKEGG